MRVLLRNLRSIVQQIFYPSICIYCHKLCNAKRQIFCKECFDLISLLDKEGRCSYCFCISDEPCSSCIHQTLKQAYVSEQEGPLYALVEKVFSGQHYRIPAIAALMAYQYLRLGFSLPDYIIPNLSLHKKQTLLLAKEMSKILQAPYRKFFLKKLRNSHILLVEFQQDQSYEQSLQAVKKINPKTLIGFTLLGPLS